MDVVELKNNGVLNSVRLKKRRMNMYELVQKIAMAVILLVGILMIVMPKKVAKKSMTETRKGLFTVRILGILLAGGGILGLLLLCEVISFY